MKQRLNTLLAVLTCWLAAAAAARAGSFSTVVIDAGHGAHDIGAHKGYAYEKHFALDIARRLERYLGQKGIRTVMTRSTDRFVPLETRAAISNSINGSVFVSIHVNDASNTGARGVETWYYSGAGASLASLVQAQILANTAHGGNRGTKAARFKVLRANIRPAILVETGFISNSGDLSRLRNPAYREALARSVGNGLIQFKRR